MEIRLFYLPTWSNIIRVFPLYNEHPWRMLIVFISIKYKYYSKRYIHYLCLTTYSVIFSAFYFVDSK